MEYFVVTNSFAAPFFSDKDECFIEAKTPEEALKKCAKKYTHPCGLFAALCYESATAYHKGKKALAQWLCNHKIKEQKITKDLGGYSYMGHGPGDFEVNGKRYKVKNPKGGKVVTTSVG